MWPELWPYIAEEARHGFGVKYGRFRASADVAQARASRELLDLVAGSAYIPEKERAVEIDAALDDLLAAHHGFSNFHTEPAPVRALYALIGERGEVPEPVTQKYIRSIVEVFLGNSYGISWAADSVYSCLLGKFESDHASLAIRMFLDPTISAQLCYSVGQQKWRGLLDIIGPKLTKPTDRDLLAALLAFTGTPDQLRLDTGIKKILARASPSTP